MGLLKQQQEPMLMNRKYMHLLLISGLLLTCSTALQAQHSSHVYRYTGTVQVEHIPDHDDVLPSLPDNILLRFTDHVSLVKLVVKTDDGTVVNIDFHYNPVPDRVFIWPLPELPKSDWYQVDWGAVDRARKLMSGKFLFSAGPDAKAPSTMVVEEEIDHIVVPDYRLVNPDSYRPVTPAP